MAFGPDWSWKELELRASFKDSAGSIDEETVAQMRGQDLGRVYFDESSTYTSAKVPKKEPESKITKILKSGELSNLAGAELVFSLPQMQKKTHLDGAIEGFEKRGRSKATEKRGKKKAADMSANELEELYLRKTQEYMRQLEQAERDALQRNYQPRPQPPSLYPDNYYGGIMPF